MLAQLVEQRTFNPFVVGSTPAHPTKIKSTKCLISKASYTEAFVIFGFEMSLSVLLRFLVMARFNTNGLHGTTILDTSLILFG